MAALANLQDEAAASFEKAGSKVEGFSHSVSETHGSYCNPSIEALERAEKALEELTAALKESSERLAARLRVAKERYRSADQLY